VAKFVFKNKTHFKSFRTEDEVAYLS